MATEKKARWRRAVAWGQRQNKDGDVKSPLHAEGRGNRIVEAALGRHPAGGMVEFQRKRNRLESAAYRGRRAYFLTLCAQDRRTIFHSHVLVNALVALLEKTCAAYSFLVYAYCFMPDHLHLILVGDSGTSELVLMVRAFKGAAATVARKSKISSLWQKGYYDHVLRSGKSLDEAAWYVFLNPVRAGLAKTVHEWPFSGSFVFEWKCLEPPLESFQPPWKEDGQGDTGGEKTKGKMAT